MGNLVWMVSMLLCQCRDSPICHLTLCLLRCLPRDYMHYSHRPVFVWLVLLARAESIAVRFLEKASLRQFGESKLRLRRRKTSRTFSLLRYIVAGVAAILAVN